MGSDGQHHRHHRLLFIDNLRWSAIAMVVVIHAAVTYSGIGSWYVSERVATSRPVVIGLATYQSLQHAVAMGLLFGIAGYFAGAALQRRGPGSFLAERAYRLGLPLLLYMFVIGPLTEYFIARTWRSTRPSSFVSEWLSHIGDGRIFSGSGPLWFCLVLLVFSLALAAIERVCPVGADPARPPPGLPMIATFALAMATVTFVTGVIAPANLIVLNVVVHDLPQYPLMFAAGVLAQRGNWLLRFPSAYGPSGVVAGLVVGLASWFAILEFGGAFCGELASFGGGGWHWQAAAVDLWRSLACLALGVGLVTVYRDHCNRQGRLARFLTANAFGVYLFHPPILVAITQALHDVRVGNLLKFAVASLAAVTATFLLVGLVARRTPVVRAVL